MPACRQQANEGGDRKTLARTKPPARSVQLETTCIRETLRFKMCHIDADVTPRSYQPRLAFTTRTTSNITGTSTSTPTTVASAAPD